MHAKFHKRSLHRRSNGGVLLPRLAASKAEVRGIDPLLNGPVTLTITVVNVPTGATSIATLSDVPTVSSLPIATQTIPTSPTTAPPPPPPPPPPVSPTTSTTELSSASTQSPIVSITSTSTAAATNSNFVNPNSSSASQSPTSVNTPAAQDNGAVTVNLSSGAVAGIVIGCLIVLVAAIVIGLRKRSTKNRLKLRSMWVSSKALTLGRSGSSPGSGAGARGDMAPTPYTYQPAEKPSAERQGDLEGAEERRMSYVRGRPVTATFASAPAGTDARSPVSAGSISPLILDLPRALPSAYGYAESVSSPLRSATAGGTENSAVVARTFIPSLPDELTISMGETLDVIEVFDDGWAECANRSGDVGMVPLECFDRASIAARGLGGSILASSPVVSGEVGSRNSRRYTSLPSARR